MKRHPMKMVLPLDEDTHRFLWLALLTRKGHLEGAEDANTNYVQTQIKFCKELLDDLEELESPRHMAPAYNLLDKGSKHG